MKKRLLSVLLVTLMLLTSITYAAKDVDYFSMDNDQLVELSGLDSDEIQYGKDYYGEDFNIVFDDYIKRLGSKQSIKVKDIIAEDRESGEKYNIGTNRMNRSNWNFMKEKFKTGQILITKDNVTLGYSHGHSAILLNDHQTVEHPGKKDDGEALLSGIFKVEDRWRNYDTIESLNYSSNSRMKEAAEYAEDYLTDWKYAALADRDNKKKMNCATLVWKAYYYGADVDIVDTAKGTVYPEDFERSK